MVEASVGTYDELVIGLELGVVRVRVRTRVRARVGVRVRDCHNEYG